jgi:hypothetical protein
MFTLSGSQATSFPVGRLLLPYRIREGLPSSDGNASKRELMKIVARKAEHRRFPKQKAQPASGLGNPGERARIRLARFSARRRNHDWLRGRDDALEFAAVAHNDDVVHDGKGKARNVERRRSRTIGIDGVGALEGAVMEKDAAEGTFFIGDLREVAVAVESPCAYTDDLLDGAGDVVGSTGRRGWSWPRTADAQAIDTFQGLVAAGESLIPILP